MQRRQFMATTAAMALPAYARASSQTFTIILDWFINPDHAPLFAAKYCGAYEAAGLEVKLIAPTDPDLPPRLLAAGKADACLSYQPQLYLLVDQGLPVRRTGTLIDKPLNTLTALGGRRIKTLADLKGRRIGYSVAGMETVQIATMLKSAGLTLADVILVNVNFNLVSALQAREVDAVIGTYRTYEDIQLAQAGLDPVIFAPEDYGVPESEELILLSSVAGLQNPALKRFLGALQAGMAALHAQPEKMLALFLAENPSLNDRLDIAAWHALPPYFAKNPGALDAQRYLTYRDFLGHAGLIQHKLPLAGYAVEL